MNRVAGNAPVLVVDDDPDIALLCTLHLELAGFDVLVAETGIAAFETCRTARPRAVVLDFMLPDVDGLQVLKRLNEDPMTRGIPVIMLTARTHEGDQVAAWEAGVVEFITKPFDGAVLVEAVRQAVAPAEPGQRERHRSEALARLRSQETDAARRMAAIVEGADDAVIGKNLAGVIVSWNAGAEQLYGWNAEEAIGQHVGILATSGRTDETPGHLARIAAGERVPPYETTRQRKDGTVVLVSLTVSPIKGPNGRVIGASTISRDVTERHEAEQRFRRFIETSPHAVVIVDADGTIEFASTETESLFGHKREQMIGGSVEMLVPGRFGAWHSSRRPGSEDTTVPLPDANLELFALRADGTQFPAEIQLTAVGGEEGQYYGLTLRDVSVRRREDATFRRLLETAPDAIVAVDVSGRIILVNSQTEALFGYSRDELVGQLVEVLVPESLRGAHPSHRLDYFSEPRTRPMGKGLDLTARRKDGTEFPAEISLSSIETDDGLLVSAAIRDVTERKRAEARFRGLVEAAPDAMVIVDESGRIGLVNAQTVAMFGYARDELIGEPVEVLVPPRFRAQHPNHRRSYGSHPRVRPMGAKLELSGLRKDGTEFPVEISLGPLETEQGVTISAAIRDVTDRKRAEEAQSAAFEREREASRRLREVDRMRSDFLSTVSHELRTPLTAITGFAQILVQSWDSAPEPRKQEYVERILHAGTRLDHLITDLLDFSRLERGLLTIELEPHRVLSLVEHTVQRAGHGLAQHDLKVSISDELWVMADRAALGRVLENLLTNAAKFSPPGEEILVHAKRQGTEIVVAVLDRGIGIEPEHHGKIFDRFHRVPEVASSRPGTGIGLAIVKQFTEAQGGRVTLRSAPGEGSEFRVHLRAVNGQ